MRTERQSAQPEVGRTDPEELEAWHRQADETQRASCEPDIQTHLSNLAGRAEVNQLSQIASRSKSVARTKASGHPFWSGGC